MDNLAVTCLGVGDGGPCADRKHSATLYHWNGRRILIDCGEPLCDSFKATGASFDAVERILLSHYHFDHVGGFFMFIQGSWLEGRKTPLPVHLPGHGIPAIKGLLEAGCLFDELLPFPISYQPLQAGQSLDLDGWRITPFQTSHLRGFERSYGQRYPGRYECFAFLMEMEDRRVCHTADIGAPQDLDPILAGGPLDLLVCELAHFRPEDMFAYLAQAAVGKVIFTHLGRPYWENFEDVRRLADRMLPGKELHFARDGSTLSL